MKARGQVSFVCACMVLFSSTMHAGAVDIFFKKVGKKVARVAKKVGENVADSIVSFGKKLAKGDLDGAFTDLGRAVGTLTTASVRLSLAVSPVGWLCRRAASNRNQPSLMPGRFFL